MLFGFAALERTPPHAQTADTSEAPFYADDLLPALQSTLASLADLDTRHEIERDYLEGRSGPDDVERRLMAALEASVEASKQRGSKRRTNTSARSRSRTRKSA